MPTACDIHSTAFRRQRPAPKGQIQWERPTGMKTPDRKQRVLKGIQTGVCHRPHHVFRSHVPPSCTVTVLETALPLFNENAGVDRSLSEHHLNPLWAGGLAGSWPPPCGTPALPGQQPPPPAARSTAPPSLCPSQQQHRGYSMHVC